MKVENSLLDITMSRFCNVCIYESLPSRVVKFHKGDFIFHQGDELLAIFYVTEGLIKVTKMHEDGEEKVLEIVSKDDFLGLLAVLEQQATFPASAECLTDVTVKVSTTEDTLRAYDKHQPFKEACISCATTRAKVFQKHLFQLSSRSTDDKIIGFLVHLAQQFGEFKDGLYYVDLPITKQDLASIMGIRRETLSRRLHALEENKQLKFKGSKYIIKQV